MAVSTIPCLNSPGINISMKHVLFSSTVPLFNFVAVPTRTQQTPTNIVFSYKKSVDGISEEAKIKLLERYNFNSDEIVSEESSSKGRGRGKGRKELQSTGKRKKVQVQAQPENDDKKPPRSTHSLLKVLGGTARRTKLLSPKGMDVRPMMELVKGAAFDTVQAAGGCPVSLRPGRWLDLYSGTGSVGIEAISRGCTEAHFVEMDPWVISNVLRPNLEWTGFLDDSVIHAVRVENFLERSEQFVGKVGPFDYISVTPPYELVDYGVLMGQISGSALVGEDTFIVVEYPSRTDMLDTCGCLIKIKDRRFGRTNLAIYGPKWAEKKRKSDTSFQKIVV